MALVFFSEAVIKNNCYIELRLANVSHREFMCALFTVLHLGLLHLSVTGNKINELEKRSNSGRLAFDQWLGALATQRLLFPLMIRKLRKAQKHFINILQPFD